MTRRNTTARLATALSEAWADVRTANQRRAQLRKLPVNRSAS